MTGFSIEEILSKDGSPTPTSHHVDTEEYDVTFRHTDYNYRRFLPYLPYPLYPPPSHFYQHHQRYYGSRSPAPAAISPDSSANSDDLDDVDKLSRRPRTSITVCQREFLEAEFQKERYPTLAYIDKLSRKVHLQQYVIKVWFQNRRAKYRKEGHRRKTNKSQLTKDENTDNKNNTFSEQCTTKTLVDIEKTDYSPTPPHLKYNNKNTKFHPSKLMIDKNRHVGLRSPSSFTTTPPFLWQPRSKLDVTCRDSIFCHCLMCRKSSKRIQY